jgi:hypothetical protein
VVERAGHAHGLGSKLPPFHRHIKKEKEKSVHLQVK